MKKLAIAAMAAIVSASPAAAATIIQSGTIASSGPGSTTFGVQQFNASLGTLDSITLLFSSSLTATGSVTNSSNSPGFYLLGTGATATLSGGGFNILQLDGPGIQFVFVPRNSSSAFSPVNGSASSSSTLASSSFAPFVGTGSTSLTFTSTSLFWTLPGSGALSVSPLIGGNYTLTYDYTKAVVAAVPEPATWMLMIVGVGMVGGSLRRRQRKTALSFA
jgi:hypothetical protein